MQSNNITSLTNARVKEVVALRNRKHRDRSGYTIVEGEREILRAHQADVEFGALYICRELLKSSNENEKVIGKCLCPVYETTKAVFLKMSYGDRAEGILAVCTPKLSDLQNLKPKPNPLYLVVERVEKPGNLGAILRTCDGAGVDGVIICDGKTDIFNPNVIRASLGTVFSLKVVVSSNEDAYQFFQSRKVKIYATLPQAKTIYTKEKLTKPLAFVVGCEQDGLSDFWIAHADCKIKIPMHGRADSLNVSASTAVLLYEIVRQRSS